MSEAGPAAFEARLGVLESRKIISSAMTAAMVLGALALVLAFAKVFPPGALGLHVLIVSAIVRRSHARTNFLAKRRERTVRVTPEGVFVDGVLTVTRTAIADGYFQPRPDRDPGSSLKLVDKKKRILFEVEADEQRARQMLQLLRLDAENRRAVFAGSSPLYATTGRNLAFVFSMIGAALGIGAFSTAVVGANLAPFFPVLMASMVFAGMIPSQIAVGLDGILVRWLWRKTFIPMGQIRNAFADGDRAITLRLVSGETETLYTSMARRGGSNRFTVAHRDAVLARIREALLSHRSVAKSADAAALVARGAQTQAEWLASLAKLRDARGSYREAAVRDDDLWKVVEDPTAPEDARAGAAMVLRGSLDDSGRTRVRVAAEAAASPKLRVALDAVTEESDERAHDALNELAS